MTEDEAKEILKKAYNLSICAFFDAHKQMYNYGPVVKDKQLNIEHVCSSMLVCDEIVYALSKYMIVPQDIQLFFMLISQCTKNVRICEIGRLLGISSYCLSSLGATVVSVDANGCDDWNWDVYIDFIPGMINDHGIITRCNLIDQIKINNKIINKASHLLLKDVKNCKLIDDKFDINLCNNFDIVFEDIWYDSTEDQLIYNLFLLVKNNKIKWLIIHDVNEFCHVKNTLNNFIDELKLNVVYAGASAVIYNDIVPNVYNVECVNNRWNPAC